MISTPQNVFIIPMTPIPPPRMRPIERAVYEETLRFRKALPELLKDHRGQWVVFLHGRPRGFFPNGDEAYLAALDAFGCDGGFVVAPVVEEQTVMIPSILRISPVDPP